MSDKKATVTLWKQLQRHCYNNMDMPTQTEDSSSGHRLGTSRMGIVMLAGKSVSFVLCQYSQVYWEYD